MQTGTVRPADERPTRARSAPRWLVAVSASFAALWGLLFYCDLFRMVRVLAKIQGLAAGLAGAPSTVGG